MESHLDQMYRIVEETLDQKSVTDLGLLSLIEHLFEPHCVFFWI